MGLSWKSAVVGAAALLGGCSTYPVPQDVTGSTTEQIVTNVRCQARRAVRTAFRNTLQAYYEDIPVMRFPRADGHIVYTGKSLIKAIDNEDINYKEIRPEFFVGGIRAAIDYYKLTQVAYEFNFDLKENNKQGFNINFLRQFLRRQDQIGIGASTDLTRQTQRSLTIRDSFVVLLTGIKSWDCRNERNVNIVYPMTGRLPVYDLVSTYIALNERDILQQIKPTIEDYSGSAKKKIPQIADTITFTSKLISANNPTIEYNPLGQGFGVAGLGFKNENERDDIHKVVVTITTSEPDQGVRSQGRAVPRTAANRPVAQRLEADALDAIRAQRERNFQDAVISISNSLSRLSGF